MNSSQIKSFTIYAGSVAAAISFSAITSCTIVPEGYVVEELVPGSKMHGVHGLAFDADGMLYGASLTGRAIYKIDVETGIVEIAEGPNDESGSDDVAVGPDGTLAWTASHVGAIVARAPGGKVKILATGLNGANSINFASDGRLFATTIFAGDALYEIDVKGKQPAAKILEGLGGLNGFEVADNNLLYGPLFFRGKIVSINLETGSLKDVADGFTVPAAVNLDSQGNIIVVDIETGEVTRVNRDTGTKELIAQLEPPLDNLAIDKNDRIYVSNTAFNRITEIDPSTDTIREIVQGGLSSPGGIALIEDQGQPAILVSDFWGHRLINAETGVISMPESERRVSGSIHIDATDDFYILSSIWPFSGIQLVDRSEGTIAASLGGFGAPYDVDVLDNGNLLVADFATGQLIETSQNQNAPRRLIAQGLGGPIAMVGADEDSVYVSETTSGVISQISLSDGRRTVAWEGLNQPEGIALDAKGRLIIAEVGARRIIAIDLDAQSVEVVAANLPLGLGGWATMPRPFLPTGVAVDKLGAIYVTSDIDNALYKISHR